MKDRRLALFLRRSTGVLALFFSSCSTTPDLVVEPSALRPLVETSYRLKAEMEFLARYPPSWVDSHRGREHFPIDSTVKLLNTSYAKAMAKYNSALDSLIAAILSPTRENKADARSMISEAPHQILLLAEAFSRTAQRFYEPKFVKDLVQIGSLQALHVVLVTADPTVEWKVNFSIPETVGSIAKAVMDLIDKREEIAKARRQELAEFLGSLKLPKTLDLSTWKTAVDL